jgi:hypothetical protein
VRPGFYGVARPSRYSQELRDRAVRMVAEVRPDYPFLRAAGISQSRAQLVPGRAFAWAGLRSGMVIQLSASAAWAPAVSLAERRVERGEEVVDVLLVRAVYAFAVVGPAAGDVLGDDAELDKAS